jgi:hypothetical protein
MPIGFALAAKIPSMGRWSLSQFCIHSYNIGRPATFTTQSDPTCDTSAIDPARRYAHAALPAVWRAQDFAPRPAIEAEVEDAGQAACRWPSWWVLLSAWP